MLRKAEVMSNVKFKYLSFSTLYKIVQHGVVRGDRKSSNYNQSDYTEA